jgi:hypothetical protein
MMRFLLAAGMLAIGLNAQSVFSHKTHAPLKMPCGQCHAGAAVKERAGFPALAQCQGCHKDWSAKIPSQRVYKVRDFVFFSHAAHKDRTECADCHGDLWQQASVTMFRPTTMIACVDCHKEKKATQVCNSCHELGQ